MRKLPAARAPYTPVHFVWPVVDGSGMWLVITCDDGPKDWCRRGSGRCHYLRVVTWTEDPTVMTECDYGGFPCVPRIGPVDFTPIGETDCGQPRYAWFYRECGVAPGCEDCRARGGHSRECNVVTTTDISWRYDAITGRRLLCRCWDRALCEPCHIDVLSCRADAWRASRLSSEMEYR